MGSRLLPDESPVWRGQVYRACRPGARGRLVTVRRVIECPGWGTPFNVQVCDMDGSHLHWVKAEHLHSSPTTRYGRPRRSGYALVPRTEPAELPTGPATGR